MNNISEMFKYLSLLLFIFFSKYKLNASAVSGIFLGVGTGVIANVMFVLTTTTDFQIFNLSISFLLGIILLAIGSLEKKEQ
jgi:peptidoglycan/LPS O-acetylase OafA/YrhL